MKKSAIHKLIIAVLMCFFLCVLGCASPSKKDLSSVAEFFVDSLADSGIEFAANPLDEQLLQQRKIVIATDINAASALRVIRGLLLLAAIDASAPIDLYIRTEGGWVSDAFGIIDTIQSLEAPVNTHAVGGTHSSGAMILAAGTGVRYAYPFSLIMFHAGLDEDDEEYGSGRVYNQRWVSFWETHSKVPSEWIHTDEDSEFYLGPEDALKFGIVDQIRESVSESLKRPQPNHSSKRPTAP